MSYRIGFGYDVHRLAAGESLILGGISIPHPTGTVGHSDADVLIHAICDALLGAAALGDIGYHFPDTDPIYKNADSTVLLAKVIKLLKDKGYGIGNIDSTVCLEKPKLKDYIPKMQQRLAEVLVTTADKISIKATTSEKLGFVGREEGVTAHAVVLIESTGS
ncbi:MAG: 2-C-methyl-D-erythritol 2,4-cyclodiphosphate synthase [Bacteroidia bacterium]